MLLIIKHTVISGRGVGNTKNNKKLHTDMLLLIKALPYFTDKVLTHKITKFKAYIPYNFVSKTFALFKDALTVLLSRGSLS